MTLMILLYQQNVYYLWKNNLDKIRFFKLKLEVLAMFKIRDTEERYKNLQEYAVDIFESRWNRKSCLFLYRKLRDLEDKLCDKIVSNREQDDRFPLPLGDG